MSEEETGSEEEKEEEGPADALDPADPTAAVMAVATPLFACMPLECPEPGAGGYEEMGICTLMINIGLGSIAPMLPILDIMLDPVVKIPELGSLDLPALPFLGLTIPPLPFPDPVGLQGSLEFPSWPGIDIPGIPALMDLLFGILTIPLNMCLDIVKLKVPDLSIDGILELLLPALAFAVDLPMLPTIGLLDLAICIILLLLLPFILLALVIQSVLPEDALLLEPFEAAFAAVGLDGLLGWDANKIMADAQDTEAIRAKAEKILDRITKEEEEKKAAAARRDAKGAVIVEDDVETEWKPSIKDYYYG